MKKEFMNIFFLVFAAYLIAKTTNSEATNVLHQSYKLKQEVVCKDFSGLEKLFSQEKTFENEAIPLTVKTKCRKKNESYVKNDDFKFDRFSSPLIRNF